VSSLQQIVALIAVHVENFMSTNRKWKFYVEDENGSGRYVDERGEENSDDVLFIGGNAEANREAERRSGLWESYPSDGWILKVTLESHGIVKNEQK
jgi:hypothetical protein